VKTSLETLRNTFYNFKKKLLIEQLRKETFLKKRIFNKFALDFG